MNQAVTELLVRAIKQTLNDVKNYMETNTGDADRLVNKLQRLEISLSSFYFENDQYRETLMNTLHDIAVDLDSNRFRTNLEDELKTESEEK